jgi:hypothetical protein
LNIQQSDTNGDGTTTAIAQHVEQRLIKSTDPLGTHKPFGCFVDVSLRIVKGKQVKITTVWENLNQEKSSRHDNSAPLCHKACPAGTKLFEQEEVKQENGVLQRLPPFVVNALGFSLLMVFLACFVSRTRGSTQKFTRIQPQHEQDSEDKAPHESHRTLLGTEGEEIE